MLSKNHRAIYFLIIMFVAFCGLSGCQDSGHNSGAEGDQTNIASAWNPEPSDITLAAGESYLQINGRAVDENRPSQRMTCSASTNTCSFNILAAGIGSGAVSCFVKFAAPFSAETCGIDLVVSDDQGVSISHTVTITVEQGVGINNCVPNPVDEGNAVSCDVAATGGTAEVDAVNDTCGGALLGDSYSFTTNESEGPGSCLAAIEIFENPALKDSEPIIINEVNQPPSFTSTAPTTASENVAYTYVPSATDVDIPVQALTITINGADTCGGALADGTYSWTPGETNGGITCVVGLNVTDGVATVSQNTTVTIAETNELPVWSTTPVNVNLLTGQTYNSANGAATDADLPAQTLSCSGLNSTCSFPITVTGSGSGAANCNVSFAAQGTPASCAIDVQVSDGSGGTITQNIGITIQQCRFFVDDSASGTGDGSSWADAYNVLQPAVDVSWNTCEIWVAEGNYYRLDRSASNHGTVLSFKTGIKVYGGFVGTEVSLAQRTNPLAHLTVLDGESVSYSVVSALNVDNYILDGFKVIGGNASVDFGAYATAAGMWLGPSTNATVNNCIFQGNTAYGSAAGIRVDFCAGAVISNCMFLANHANNWEGGAIWNEMSTLTITNCLFQGNTAGTNGGAIYNDGGYSNVGALTIQNCTFTGNTAGGYGGALQNDYISATIINTIMWNDSDSLFDEIDNNFSAGSATISYSDIDGGCATPGNTCGVGNINSNPLFVAGPLGNYYLSQIASGQAGNSPCFDTGDPAFPLIPGTTRTDGTADSGTVDMGYHYQLP